MTHHSKILLTILWGWSFLVMYSPSLKAQQTASNKADTTSPALPVHALDTVLISTTRNNQRIENTPLKVEVLGREEMDEESGIKPAGIGSILGDISGIQIQQSSAINANANIRIQGLDGRYTQLLRDGLPLYEGFSGGFGILSIPPLDLKQVELIKGSASTLYGGGAIGGIVNIISRIPTARQESVLCLNRTTLQETNLNSYFSRRYKKFGYTLLAGINSQQAVDVNKDGISDVPKWRGWVIHPRLHWYPDQRTTLTLGYSGTFENRTGGDMQVIPSLVAQPGHSYFEKNNTDRNSWEWIVQQKTKGQEKWEWKGTYGRFLRRIQESTFNFSGAQQNWYTEFSYLLPRQYHQWVMGINGTGDRFRKLTPTIPLSDFSNQTWGIFIQDTWTFSSNGLLELGLRNDLHATYGNFLLPRLALFYRFDPHWAGRAGFGTGYKTPNPLAVQNTDLPLSLLQPLSSLTSSEHASGYNLEFNYKKEGKDFNLFINQAFFYTKIRQPLLAIKDPAAIFFVNQLQPLTTKGADTYVRATIEDWELYAGYTFTLAQRTLNAQRELLALTPRHRFAGTALREWEATGMRMGLEASYTGSQLREDRSKTPGYFFVAMMIEKKLGAHCTLVLNGENLLDFRQSNIEPLYMGSIAQPVFKALWAPIDGRVLNLSLKWKR